MESIEDALRQANEALNQGDVETFLGYHTDDVVIHWPGRSPIAGEHRGKQKFAELVRGRQQAGVTTEIHEILASGDHAVLLGLNRMEPPGGQPFEDRQVVVFHHRDGKVSEIWIYPEDQYAIDEMMSRMPR